MNDQKGSYCIWKLNIQSSAQWKKANSRTGALSQDLAKCLGLMEGYLGQVLGRIIHKT